jgi:hypothetical protein
MRSAARAAFSNAARPSSLVLMISVGTEILQRISLDFGIADVPVEEHSLLSGVDREWCIGAVQIIAVTNPWGDNEASQQETNRCNHNPSVTRQQRPASAVRSTVRRAP